MSIRLRVGALTALAVALVELAIVASMYAAMSDRLHAQVQDDLRRTSAVLVPIVTATGDFPRPGQDPERAPNIRRVITAEGTVVSVRSTQELPVSEAARRVAGEGGERLEIVSVGSAASRENFYVLTVHAGAGRAVQVARSLTPVEDLLQQLLVSAVAFGTAGVAAGLVAGAAIGAGALAPLGRVSRAVDRITRTGDLAQRVGLRGRDELATFATGFDAMLDRLEGMVDEVESARRLQRQLVADASHELRAPLATLRANVELLSLGEGAPVGDRDELVADTLKGIEDLTGLVSQLIDLAREDRRVHERTPLRLDALVSEELDRARRRYPSVDFQARLAESTAVGDAEALARAIANLLDNAAKWSPAGGAVEVTLVDGVLEVADHGPGIDPADLPHVFERFYRGARAAGIPGSGLGLAIVAQVMASHGGQVSARSTPDGTTMTATFVRESS